MGRKASLKRRSQSLSALLKESCSYVAEAPRGTLSALINALLGDRQMCLNTSNLLLPEVNEMSLCRDDTCSALKNKYKWVMHTVSLLCPYVQGSGMQNPFSNSHWPFLKVSEVFGAPLVPFIDRTSKWLTDREQCWSSLKFVLLWSWPWYLLLVQCLAEPYLRFVCLLDHWCIERSWFPIATRYVKPRLLQSVFCWRLQRSKVKEFSLNRTV